MSYLPNLVEINKFKVSKKKSDTKKIKFLTVARFAPKKKGYDLLPKIATFN